MSDASGENSVFEEETLTVREHMDADKHWIGETLAPPTQSEIAGTVGTVSGPGDSPFVARADHTHKLDAAIFPVFVYVFPASADDATTTTTMTTWHITNAFTVPTWATAAIVQVNLTGIYMVTSGSTTYALDVTILGGNYSGDYAAFSPLNINDRISVSYCKTVTGFGTGAGMNVRIGARRVSGTGTARADSASKITGFVMFRT